MKDLELLAANFITCTFNKEDEYLQKYFPDENQRKLIIYYKTFGYTHNKHNCFTTFWNNFIDHTGVFCSKRWVVKHLERLRLIESALKNAELQFDLSSIEQIKTGKLKFKK